MLFGAPGEATTSEVGFAAKSGDVETVEYLLTGLGMKVDKKDSVGKLPIHWACYGGSVEVVQFLIKRGAKVHDKKGLPPLHIAASWGSVRPPSCRAISAMRVTHGGPSAARLQRGARAVHGERSCRDDCTKPRSERMLSSSTSWWRMARRSTTSARMWTSSLRCTWRRRAAG